MKLPRRRDFLKGLGASAATLPFLSGLPSVAHAAGGGGRKQRLIIMFSPNGTVPERFWPKTYGEDFEFSSILKSLEPFRDQTLLLNGVCNKVKGDGDSHMRGISCLLSGIELAPGNVQGGGNTPAGWASGISIDQEIKNFFQSQEATRTRFGSLEFGVAVPNRADPWTRMSYAGGNRPIAPVTDPRLMLRKLYGDQKNDLSVHSVLDKIHGDLDRIANRLGKEDRTLLDEHMTLVREVEREIEAAAKMSSENLVHPEPEVDPQIELINDNTPQVSRVQIDLLVNAMANDMARVGTLQYMRSVGQAKMSWLGIKEGHHGLSHEPDENAEAQDKLEKINRWFCEELVYLVKKLKDTPEPGGEGSLLDHTQIVWTNELGKGNNHTLNNIPMVLVGGGCDFKTGQAIKFESEAHNRLLLSLAHGLGHPLETFGSAPLCAGGVLPLS